MDLDLAHGNNSTEMTATEVELTQLLYRTRDAAYSIADDENQTALRVRYIIEKLVASLAEGKDLPRVRG
jgi:hypothetical protein